MDSPRALAHFLCQLLLALFLCHGGAVGAQAPKPAVPPAAAPAAAPAEEAPPAPKAFNLAEVAVEAEAGLAQVRRIAGRGRMDELIKRAEAGLALLARETSFRFREMQQLLRQNVALESIRVQEEEWRDLDMRTSAITRDLTKGVRDLDQDIKELEKLTQTWEATAKAATEASAPQEVLERVREVNAAIAKARQRLLDDRAEVLAMQSRSAEIGGRVAEARQSLTKASERAVTSLLYRDSLPLWHPEFWTTWINSVSGEARADLWNQAQGVVDFSSANPWRYLYHGLLFVALVALLYAMRANIGAHGGDSEASLRRVGRVFDMPVTSAFLIAMLCSTWFYERPPRALWVLISFLGAPPLLAFMRRVIERRLYPILYGVVGFFLANQLLVIFAPLPGIARLMFLGEALCMSLFALWLLQASELRRTAPPWTRESVARMMRLGCWLALAVALVALAANIGGYVRLADLVVGTALGSAYTAVWLYALARLGESVVHGVMYVPPVSYLRMVQGHRMLLSNRFNRWLRVGAFLSWIALTLQVPGLLQPALAMIAEFWSASATIGSFTISVEDLAYFFLAIWLAVVLSRFLRFVLEEEVYPNLNLDRGLPYAVSTLLHYVLLVTGVVIGLGILGVDMTRFTIVAGAFSVGIGFGLQNIVNNFVSGLIVLFERPIKVGDTIQIDDVIGRVQHIGIRASVVRSTAGSEVIIPNAKLISDKVTNWTLSSQLRQIAVPILTKPDIDVPEFKRVLLDIAARDPRVADKPAPEVLFIRRALDSFEFELRVWTPQVDAWLEVKSDLITGINEALRQAEMAAQAQAQATETSPPRDIPAQPAAVPPDVPAEAGAAPTPAVPPIPEPVRTPFRPRRAPCPRRAGKRV